MNTIKNTLLALCVATLLGSQSILGMEAVLETGKTIANNLVDTFAAGSARSNFKVAAKKTPYVVTLALRANGVKDFDSLTASPNAIDKALDKVFVNAWASKNLTDLISLRTGEEKSNAAHICAWVILMGLYPKLDSVEYITETWKFSDANFATTLQERTLKPLLAAAQAVKDAAYEQWSDGTKWFIMDSLYPFLLTKVYPQIPAGACDAAAEEFIKNLRDIISDKRTTLKTKDLSSSYSETVEFVIIECFKQKFDTLVKQGKKAREEVGKKRIEEKNELERKRELEKKRIEEEARKQSEEAPSVKIMQLPSDALMISTYRDAPKTPSSPDNNNNNLVVPAVDAPKDTPSPTTTESSPGKPSKQETETPLQAPVSMQQNPSAPDLTQSVIEKADLLPEEITQYINDAKETDSSTPEKRKAKAGAKSKLQAYYASYWNSTDPEHKAKLYTIVRSGLGDTCITGFSLLTNPENQLCQKFHKLVQEHARLQEEKREKHQELMLKKISRVSEAQGTEDKWQEIKEKIELHGSIIERNRIRDSILNPFKKHEEADTEFVVGQNGMMIEQKAEVNAPKTNNEKSSPFFTRKPVIATGIVSGIVGATIGLSFLLEKYSNSTYVQIQNIIAGAWYSSASWLSKLPALSRK